MIVVYKHQGDCTPLGCRFFSVQQFGAQDIMPVGKNIRFHHNRFTRNPLDRIAATVDLRFYAFDKNPIECWFGFHAMILLL